MSVLSYFLITWVAVGTLLYFANPSRFLVNNAILIITSVRKYFRFCHENELNNNIYIENDNGRLAKYIYNVQALKIKIIK